MMLATATADGRPSAAGGLAEGGSMQRGFVFYTNLESRKAERAVRQPARRLVLSVEVAEPAGPRRGRGRAGLRGRGRRLFRQPAARQPDRRLGLRPVAAARQPRASSKSGSTMFTRRFADAARSCGRISGPGFGCAPSGSSSGRTSPLGCMIGWCSCATARAGDGNGSFHDDPGPRPTALVRCGPAPPTPRSRSSALLIAVKFAAWLDTGSVALLSSLVDSLLDVAASIVNLFAVRHALSPADREHRFGHGKAEPLAALGQSAFITGGAMLLIFEAVSRVVHPAAGRNAPARHRRDGLVDRW